MIGFDHGRMRQHLTWIKAESRYCGRALATATARLGYRQAHPTGNPAQAGKQSLVHAARAMQPIATAGDRDK